jgi:SAM-dependent methyltransferase
MGGESNTNFDSAKQFVSIKRGHGHESLSGPGSHISNTKEVVQLIPNIINKYSIRSILDLGCGDWNWFKTVPLPNNLKYIGWDCDEKMVADNNRKYGRENISFHVSDICTEPYPKVDLVICRDVLFHLDASLANSIIRRIREPGVAKYFLSTSFNTVTKNVNISPYNNIENWGFYKINLNIEPFNLSELEILESVTEKKCNTHGFPRSVNMYSLVAASDARNGATESDAHTTETAQPTPSPLSREVQLVNETPSSTPIATFLSKEHNTFIIGYWHVDNNHKHPPSYYLSAVPNTLSLVRNQNAVIITNSDTMINRINECRHPSQNIIIYKTEVEDLETYPIAEDFLTSCKKQKNEQFKDRLEKGVVHWRREYKQSGEKAYKAIITIWMSKLFEVQRIAKINPYNTKYFTWIDMGFSHKNIFHNYIFPSNKQLFHIDINTMKYFGGPMRFNAAMMSISSDFLEEFLKVYRDLIQVEKDSNYAHDEETICNILIKRHPHMFRAFRDLDTAKQ